MTVIFTTILICLGRYLIHRNHTRTLQDDELEADIIGISDKANGLSAELKDKFPNIKINKYDYRKGTARNILLAKKSTDIFIADERLDREEIMMILSDNELSHHNFRLVLDIFKRGGGEIRFTEIDEIPALAPHCAKNSYYIFIKRCFDIVTSVFGILLCIPAWIVIPIVIRLDSNGPVFIRQTRVGKDGKEFSMFKFRTMKIDTPLYNVAPMDKNDGRITRIGKILRHFSLDELPQFWNILRGDMSLVGPRPEMPFIVNNYSPWQRFRLKVKPGLTGLWQILGRKDLPLHHNLEYDFYYVAGANMLLDLSIIIKTLPAIIFGRGAY